MKLSHYYLSTVALVFIGWNCTLSQAQSEGAPPRIQTAGAQIELASSALQDFRVFETPSSYYAADGLGNGSSVIATTYELGGFLWSPTEGFQPLPIPEGELAVSPVDIEEGVVRRILCKAHERDYLLSDGEYEAFPVAPPGYSNASLVDINRDGLAVGSIHKNGIGSRAYFAFGSLAGDLNFLLSPEDAQSMTLTRARRINDTGVILSEAIIEDELRHVYLLSDDDGLQPTVLPKRLSSLVDGRIYLNNNGVVAGVPLSTWIPTTWSPNGGIKQLPQEFHSDLLTGFNNHGLATIHRSTGSNFIWDTNSDAIIELPATISLPDYPDLALGSVAKINDRNEILATGFEDTGEPRQLFLRPVRADKKS